MQWGGTSERGIEDIPLFSEKRGSEKFLEFTSSPLCPQTILRAYERAKHRKLQEV
jgi:hypothetical protein